ncbi:hypothetical protein [Flavisolibacter tropicus]|uniref:Virulence factor Evf domain-containing protein n=1 Tax=Flavisolibacter tropicus TaxID=1492898 RepID=A0A172TUA7_9BACT|nr:hypothetical protein [Flavisolibacter tropicus]ANE50620.1 hypothetical protein SY85_09015 [Flavisolibacter tropicus]
MEVISPVQQDPIAYVSDLEIGLPKAAPGLARGEGEPEGIKLIEGVEQAFIADKSLISFITNVPAQNREDILQSTLLAQLAANKKYPKEDDILHWYQMFAEVLSNIGWLVEGKDISTFESSGQVFEVQDAIIKILTAAFGGNYLSVITKTLEAVKALSDEDRRILAFEKNTHTLKKGCFQIGLAVVEKDAVFLHLGTFLLTSDHKIKQILFFRATKDKTKLEYISKRATFSPVAYSQIRNTVAEKIKEHMTAYVSEISI